MCIGIPMRVISTEPGFVVCTGLGGQRRVDREPQLPLHLRAPK